MTDDFDRVVMTFEGLFNMPEKEKEKIYATVIIIGFILVFWWWYKL